MFWDNYVQLCEEKGDTPTGAMKKMGISTGNIHRWQSGGSPTGDMLITLTKYFHCSADFLLTGKNYNDHDDRIIKNSSELSILSNFRMLPQDLQSSALVYVKGLLDAYMTTKKESEKSRIS